MHLDRILLDEFTQFVRIDSDDAVDNFAHIADWFNGGHVVLSVAPMSRAALVVEPGTATATPAAADRSTGIAAVHANSGSGSDGRRRRGVG